MRRRIGRLAERVARRRPAASSRSATRVRHEFEPLGRARPACSPPSSPNDETKPDALFGSSGHVEISFSRPISRSTANPKVSRLSGSKRSCENGMRNSAFQPWSSFVTATSQTASQLSSWLRVAEPVVVRLHAGGVHGELVGGALVVVRVDDRRGSSRRARTSRAACGCRRSCRAPCRRRARRCRGASCRTATRASVWNDGAAPSFGSRCTKLGDRRRAFPRAFGELAVELDRGRAGHLGGLDARRAAGVRRGRRGGGTGLAAAPATAGAALSTGTPSRSRRLAEVTRCPSHGSSRRDGLRDWFAAESLGTRAEQRRRDSV